jgi:hypothetical protein
MSLARKLGLPKEKPGPPRLGGNTPLRVASTPLRRAWKLNTPAFGHLS